MTDKLKKREDDAAAMASLMENADLSQRPDFIPQGDRTGTQDITQEDIRLPRINIAQGLSPEVLPGPEKIAGLEVPQMFNDFSKKNYGTGPIYFIPVRRDRRCIQFRPRSEGGGVIDINVPWNDPRATEWRVGAGPKGEDLPPLATRFNEWVALILLNPAGDTEPAIISVKMTNKDNRKAAQSLNGFIKMHASQGQKSVPIYGVIYKMTTRAETNAKGTFGVPMFDQVGFVPGTDVGKMLFERAQEYAAAIQDKTTVAPREPGDEDFVDAELATGGPTY